MKPKGIAILGCTGSIGCNTLRVVESLGSKRFRVVALAAGRNVEFATRIQPKQTVEPGTVQIDEHRG